MRSKIRRITRPASNPGDRIDEGPRHHQSGKYYAIVRGAGKQIKRPLKIGDLLLARRRLREFRKKVERVGTGGKAMLFKELSALWLASVQPKQAPYTYRTSSSIVRLLDREFGLQEARDITKWQVGEWRTKRSGGQSRTLAHEHGNYHVKRSSSRERKELKERWKGLRGLVAADARCFRSGACRVADN